MTKLFKILIAISFSTTSLTITNLFNKKNTAQIINQTNLDTITELSGIKLTFDSSKTNNDLNTSINKADVFINKPLTNGYTIKYFDNFTNGNNITNQNQKLGTVFIKITASLHDSLWTGTSKLLHLSLSQSKINLNTITTLTGLNNIPAIISNTNIQLLNYIQQADQFLRTKHIFSIPIQDINFYSDADGTKNINTDYQKVGIIYFQIKIGLHNPDPFWIGTSNIFSLNLKLISTITKTDLNSISSLMGLNIIYNSTWKNYYLGFQLLAATEFHDKPLLTGYIINFYSDADGTKNINNNQQAPGKVYVIIIAITTDPVWTKTSKVLSVYINPITKINLNTINMLTGLELHANKTSIFNNLSSEIVWEQGNEFKNKPLLSDYNIKYYDDSIGTKELTNKLQSVGKFWIIISAMAIDQYWEGHTNFIEINLE